MLDPDDVQDEWHPSAKKILCARIFDSKRIEHTYRMAMFKVLARNWISSPGRRLNAKQFKFEVEAITGEAHEYKPNTIYKQVERLDEELRDLSADVCGGSVISVSRVDYCLVVTGIAPYWWVERKDPVSIGLLIANASDWFTGLLLKGILRSLPPNVNLVLKASNDDEDLEKEMVKTLLAHCQGLLFVPVLNHLDPKIVQTLAMFPTVLIDRYIEGLDSIPSVHHDDYTAGRLVGQLLKVERKCPHVWVVQQKSRERGSQPLTAVLDRLAGCYFERAAGKMRVEEITAAGAEEEGGELALASVRDRIRADHGIFATTDRLAIGCRHFLPSLPAEHRPNLANIISFEGQGSGAFLDPPLTSVFGNPESLGALGARVLMRRMNTDRPLEFSHFVLQPKLLLPSGRTRREVRFSSLLKARELDPRKYYAEKSAGTQDRIVVVQGDDKILSRDEKSFWEINRQPRNA